MSLLSQIRRGSIISGALALCWTASAMAQAPDGLRLGQPDYGGNGCPAGSASATVSADGQTVSILFDSYQTKAGGTSGSTIDRKSCNVAIPVIVPPGYSVSILNIDYRGFNSLTQGSMARFNAEYFFAGQKGMNFERVFYGPLDDDFNFSNRVTSSTVSWSKCGEQTVLRTNTALTTQVPSLGGRESISSVDSADVQAAVVYSLKFQRCDGSGPVPGPGNGGGYDPGPGNGGGYPNPNPGNGGGYPNPNPGNGGGYPQPQECLQTYSGQLCRGMTVTYRYTGAVGTISAVDRYSNTLELDLTLSGRGYLRGVRPEDVMLGGNPNPYPGPGNGGGYPNPGTGIGSCSIQQGRDARGSQLFRVMAQRGAIIATVRSYGEAVDIASRSSQCRGGSIGPGMSRVIGPAF